MAAPNPEIAAHAVVRDATPFEARDELARERVQVFEDLRKCRARWLLQAEDFHPSVVHLKMVAMTLDGTIGDEVIEMRVVLQGRTGRDVRRVVQ